MKRASGSVRFLCLMRINLVGYLISKPPFQKERYWYYLTHRWKDKRVYIFPQSIYSKVNVIVRLEFELAYYDSIVYRFNHYTTRILSKSVSVKIKLYENIKFRVT